MQHTSSYFALDALSLFGLVAVSAMLLFYALEERSHWFVLAFAGACAMDSAYGFLQGAWPFGLIEAAWTLNALKRWRVRVHRPSK
jgi:hypothetical protein